jgi:DNA (cytosine-5)-methyltransferase 1
MNLGMMQNGLSQTLNITYRKTGKGSLSSVLEKEVDEKYYLSERVIKNIQERRSDTEKHWGKMDFPDTTDNQSRCISDGTSQGQGRELIAINENQRIRRLTPRECERLQGFPDDFTKGVSDTQRYKMMGNAVSVPVIEAIGKKILEVIKCLT